MSELPRIHHSCIHCGSVIAGQNQLVCGQCLQHPSQFDSALVPFNYSAPFNQFIPSLKFQHKLKFARIMSDLFIDEFQLLKRKPELKPQCIIPVPLHAKRLHQRGFNQSLEICRGITKQLDIPLDITSVKRIKNTHAQSDLNKLKRKSNMQNAFEVTRPIPYKHVALFDDVMTTGHTFNELARVLKQSGVTTIEIWAIARA
jgi:ComF family protein